MGIGYGLTRGLMADVAGAQEGTVDRREFERRARQDLLQQRLLEAQTADISAQAKQRLLPPRGVWSLHSDASGTWMVNSETGERQRVGEGKPERPISVPEGGTLMTPQGKVIGHGAPRSSATIAKTHVNEVERQIADTRRELEDVERRRPKRSAIYATPALEQDFKTADTQAGKRAQALQARLDSLSAVRDSLVGRSMGRTVSGQPAKDPATAVARLEQQYQAALARGVDPEQAKTIYNRERQKLGAPPVP